MIIKLATSIKQLDKLDQQYAKNSVKQDALYEEYRNKEKKLGIFDRRKTYENRGMLGGAVLGAGLSVGGHLLLKQKPTVKSVLKSGLLTGSTAIGGGLTGFSIVSSKNKAFIEKQTPGFMKKYEERKRKIWDKQSKLYKKYDNVVDEMDLREGLKV